ncbi:hypothetical protein M422DRAFT_39702 [Sphaerobolus stellatus SS14]|uniref:Carboxylic ester hydrolase n=1 Tax=Sphaerobolus stellatus (strain SS14) TaxID=990650 RepID=A0A0C9TN11_SPHS4|nr:hypothetical protein M422DRAFT_39702 [Sphaerobolus stellatus SS14]
MCSGSNVIGSGSHYLCDAGRLVRTSVEIEQPVIVVSINYRLGLFGFAASEALEESNRLLGDVGVGNYGLNDQLTALAWVRRHIASFGGNPSQITLFGESAGAINIHALLLSHTNATKPIANRAIIQSGVIRPPAVQSVSSQGSSLKRIMCRLGATSVDDLRKTSVDAVIALTPSVMHATDDGVFFRPNWRSNPIPENIDALIIGDCAYESVLWTPSVLLWTSVSLIRRIRAVIRGVYKADSLLRTYGLSWNTDTEDAHRVTFNILNDAHFAWPTDCVARATKAKGGVDVYRYVFDQESPFTFTAHHAVDLLYLFDNISPKGPVRKIKCFDDSPASSSGEDEEEEDEIAGRENYFMISDFSYNAKRVTEGLQERWIGFANGRTPWREDKLCVFGPEGEVGERPLEEELAERRRVAQWREALERVEPEVVYRLALELGNGPGHKAR